MLQSASTFRPSSQLGPLRRPEPRNIVRFNTDTLPEEDTRLAPGDPMPFFHKRHIGLFISVICAGMLASLLKRGILPLMQSEFGLKPYQRESAEVILMMPWSFSFLFGFFSDALPFMGSRWRSYMIMGWYVTAIALLFMSYFHYYMQKKVAKGTHDPAKDVSMYMFMLFFACFGNITSIVIGESYAVVQEKRYPRARRGHFVANLLFIQYAAEGVGQIITDFAIVNITKDGVKPLLSFQVLLLILCFFSLVPILALASHFHPAYDIGKEGELDLDYESARSMETMTTLDELAYSSKQQLAVLMSPQQLDRIPFEEQVQAFTKHMRTHLLIVWHTLRKQSTWHVVVSLCLFVFFSEFTLKYPHLQLDRWYGVSFKTESTCKILAEVMCCFGIYIWKVACSNTDWRRLFALSFVCLMVIPQMAAYILAAFNVGRKVGIYTLVSSTRGFVRAILVILEIVMVIEIAPMCGEASAVGAIVSVNTIMRLVSTTFSNTIGYVFGSKVLLTLKAADFMTNSTDLEAAKDEESATNKVAKSQKQLVATALVLCYCIRLMALSGLLCAPKQKHTLQLLMKTGRESTRYAVMTLGMLLTAILISMIVNALVLKPSITCQQAMGGMGCKNVHPSMVGQ
ncbi:hypothetical protein Poli38472_009377 [Pythium oligandrum]|uniref:Uncharacterized protein n=1 Tax=Pythium oligandrum TaxID=41045 RepID=A0A8K1CM89_PYTOL|nr:hypothetical protein Poli38472_009377 [Pythium oligandrum]|eukprot:TMW65210.1 hypothetical protein Poli38472_009377 [Pythium oligandrum]